MREIAPDAIRSATLTRRLRGYDREETAELLAEVAESYDHVRAERKRLSEAVASLRAERQEHESRSRAELDALKGQLSERDRQITDLELQIERLQQAQSKQLEDLARMREDLSNARALQGDLEAESREHGERVARSALREKALVAQIAMLVTQLKDEETRTISPSARELPERADRASGMLLRLDRVVETLERESRREAEVTLKKARERADEIVHSAELRRRGPEAEAAHSRTEEEREAGEEYGPIAALAQIEPSV